MELLIGVGTSFRLQKTNDEMWVSCKDNVVNRNLIFIKKFLFLEADGGRMKKNIFQKNCGYYTICRVGHKIEKPFLKAFENKRNIITLELTDTLR